MKLGLDLYSLRSQGWTPFEQLDYCKRLGLNVAHFGTESFQQFDDEHLREVRAHAADLGLDVEFGIGSICESSPGFRHERGTAVEQARRGLHVASVLGSPILRCLLGGAQERRTSTPLATHIANVIDTCKAVRGQALELGVKLAVETHGDLQGWEMRALIEEAGADYVGALLDTGNALMLHEDPMVTLEHLAPYLIASHIRDTVVWPHPSGAAAQWVAMGDGNVGIAEVAARYCELCPDVPFVLEILTGSPPRVLNYLEAEYWQAFPEGRAAEFARFERLVRRGLPYMGTMVTVTRDEEVPEEYAAALVAQQRYDVERSVRYCQDVLGMGE